MKKASALSLALSALLILPQAHAMDFGKPIQASILVKDQQGPSPRSFSAVKERAKANRLSVTLMNIQLSPQQRQLIKDFVGLKGSAGINQSYEGGGKLPRQADIGMNGVPVLDQGQHGACVTFAVTAAVDALLAKGDYISQLCNLELGSYLHDEGYLPSGWDGSIGPVVLNQMMAFGVISKDKQHASSCGGMKEYPVLNPSETGSPMTLNDYHQLSENIAENIYWDSVLSFYQRFENPSIAEALMENVFMEVKRVIAQRPRGIDTRLTFATLLPVDYCSAGACARYHSEEDTWALTNAINQDSDPNFGGHEMVIIGYDDDAVAVDHDGVRHQGLFHIRNSWGSRAGDHGDYYMTYDFFKKYVLAVEKVVMLKY